MARQRTLRAVVDWSWDLLADPERRMLAAPGGVRGRRHAGGGGGRLRRRSGAARPRSSTCCARWWTSRCCRSTTPPGTARGTGCSRRSASTGSERAEEAGELGDIREAHARYYLALARQADPHLRGPDQVAWQRRLHAEHDNLLAALRHLGDSGDTQAACSMVVALLWFWLMSGSSRDEVLAWVEFARGLPGEADPLDRVMIDAVHALANIMPGQPGEGDPVAVLTDVLEQIADEDLTRHPLLAAVRPMLAVAVGRERMLELLALSESHPDPWVRATAPFVRVQIYRERG